MPCSGTSPATASTWSAPSPRPTAWSPSEGTIYPLLSRLRRDGLATTTRHESSSGPPRRYYELTTAGHQALKLFTSEWDRFTTAVDRLLTQGGTP